MALFRPWSKSTNVSAGQIWRCEPAARDHFARMLEQQAQQTKRLILQPDLDPALPEFARSEGSSREDTEGDDTDRRNIGSGHWRSVANHTRARGRLMETARGIHRAMSACSESVG